MLILIGASLYNLDEMVEAILPESGEGSIILRNRHIGLTAEDTKSLRAFLLTERDPDDYRRGRVYDITRLRG